MKKVTLNDIAQKFNVSTVTVFKAISNKEGVSEPLRNSIQEYAKEIGYYKTKAENSFNDTEEIKISVVVQKKLINPYCSFYNEMYQYMLSYMSSLKFFSILEVITVENEENNVLPDTINNKSVDGIIVMGQFSQHYVDCISQTEIPFVLLDFYLDNPDYSYAISDNVFSSFNLTNMLIKEGHRKIGFVGSIKETSSIQDRYLGYYKSLISNNIELNPEWVLEDRNKDGDMLDFELPERMPTAFVCNCDETAYHFINKLKKLGYNIPEDISVVGFDNYIYSTLTDPLLTTVDFNIAKLASNSVKILKSNINALKSGKAFEARHTTNIGKIVFRDSVKKI